MRKNVVILIRNAAPYDFGGGERVPVFIAREAAKHKNLRPIVFSRSKKLLYFAKANDVDYKKTWWWSRQNWSGSRILLFPVYFVWQIVLFFYYLVLFLKYRPTVVHLQSKDDFIAGTFAARFVGARVIWSDHADLKHIFKNHRIWYKNPIGKLVYLAARVAERIVVVSKEDKRLISINIPYGSVKNKFVISYNGAFDSYKNEKKYQEFTFVSTGRLVTDKGIGELIDAFDRFSKEVDGSRLYLLSDGPEREKFERQAKSNPAIHFLGYKQNPLDYVAKSHVFLLPTYHEGFSLALVEACMLGLPVIATNVGGNPEIIRDHETGLLVPIKNTDKLYKAMIELYNDEKLRDTLSQNARKEYINKFNFETIIKNEFISFYEGKI
jgi:glycosyltransferase involved in cell wall biosynthesis